MKLIHFILFLIFFRSFSHTLLYGNNLDELIDARKKWLTPDGLIFPDRCNLYITAIDNQMLCDRSNFWQHVYTFDMQSIIPAVIAEPYFQRVNWDQVQDTYKIKTKKKCGRKVFIFIQNFCLAFFYSGCVKSMPNQASEYVYGRKTRLSSL